MQGANTAQTIPLVNGIKLALAQAGGKAGQWTVNYQVLDDSIAATGKWDPGQTAANARKVASDPKAVLYIGEFNSGASEVSIPILNEAGIPQVSPANTYVGLTTSLPGSAPGEPQKYYPTGKRTYLRIVPIDSIQAAADLIAMKQRGLHQGRRGQRQGGLRSRPGHAARAGEELLRGHDRQQHRDRPDRAQLPLLRLDDPGPGSQLLLLRRHHLQRRRPDHQGRPLGDPHRQDIRRRRGVHELLDQRGAGRRPGRDRPADRVHGRDAGPGRVSGRQGRSWPRTRPSTAFPAPTRTRSTAMR